MNKTLLLLGLAKRARKIVTGGDAVLDAIKKGKAKLVFLACDLSEKSMTMFKNKCMFKKIPVNTCFSSSELSKSIGMTRKVIALTDAGMQNKTETYTGGSL